ncbi:hypothetical protein Tco_1516398 [Tanacetum coccineum]
MFQQQFWYSFKPSLTAVKDIDWVIHEKIKNAISSVGSFPLKEIILQFWALVKDENGRNMLSTCDQPFAIARLNPRLRKYRISCMKYQYCVDVSANNSKFDGSRVCVFLNRFPEVVMDMRGVRKVGSESSLVDSALECGLTCSLFLPVFDDHSESDHCIGVVECCMNGSEGLLVISTELKLALEKFGLGIYHHRQENLAFKTISNLNPPMNEIEEALQRVCESHDLTLGQVWMPYDFTSKNHHGSFVKQWFLIKLVGCRVYSDHDDNSLSHVKKFYDTCDVIPLRLGEGLVGKTLETRQPHFCRNINVLSGENNNGLLGVLSSNAECSCLVICLKGTCTGDYVDYAFEFLWPKSRNYLILLESLLSTLKACLPSFELASCEKLGDELNVYDVQNSLGSGTGSFKILEGNRISQPSKPYKETTKRKCSDLNQQEEPMTNLYRKKKNKYDEDLAVVASYKDKSTLFLLSTSSSKLENLMERINQDFDLDQGTYKLEWEVTEGLWMRLADNESFRTFILDWKEAKKTYIEVRVTSQDYCKLSEMYPGYAQVNSVVERYDEFWN